jgi:hypothetical protein
LLSYGPDIGDGEIRVQFKKEDQMGFTSAGLANGGQTAHYQIAFDETFSRADGLNRAAQLMDQCEFDFDLMNGWFGNPGFKYSFPITVNIANATGGASWSGGYQFPFSEAATVTINPRYVHRFHPLSPCHRGGRDVHGHHRQRLVPGKR